MYVAVSVLKDSLAVTQLTEQDGRLVSTDNMIELLPRMKLGHVPYERLRILGAGVHELFEDENAVPEMPRESFYVSWVGWLVFAGMLAASAICVYWLLASWEVDPGGLRIQGLVAFVHALGGKGVVAGVFGFVSVYSLGKCLINWNTGIRLLGEKGQRLAEDLAEMMDETSRITVDDRDTHRGLYVCYDKGRLKLLLPLDHLTVAEEKRAQKFLGPLEVSQSDPDFPEVTPPNAFFVDLGSDPIAVAEQAIDLMVRLYRLHPYFELDIHSRITWTDDYDAWPESDHDVNSDPQSLPATV